MRILALILARGGSKRLPGKNIRKLGGKPLIVWSIDVVKSVPEICDILVSSDDSAIADVCKDVGAMVPWLRPAELATDNASSIDVALHALDWYETHHGAVDGLLLLQPTSPFRTRATVREGVALFCAHGLQPVVGVSPCEAHPMWAMRMAGDYLVPFLPGHGLDTRAQDLPAAYAVNGGFYLSTPADLRTTRSFVGSRTVPLIVASPQEALDIDTEWDWTMAEAVLRAGVFPDGQ